MSERHYDVSLTAEELEAAWQATCAVPFVVFDYPSAQAQPIVSLRAKLAPLRDAMRALQGKEEGDSE